VKRKTIIRVLLALIVGFVLLGLVAPYLSANLFRERIRDALQAALNRKVEMGSVHFNLFSGPGFSVEDVLIADDSGAGIEPFAHVESIKARIRFTSLFTGHLVFSKLKLVEPSVNLVKTDAGPWNIQSFFQRAVSTGAGQPGGKGQPGPLASVPDIEIGNGRINFKFGMVKSVFYINNADVSIYPKSADDLVVDFSGEPARTDTGAQGFGRFSAKGLLHRSDNGPDQLNMALHLERSALSELVRLFNSRDLGVNGYVSSNATLSGPTSHIAINGDLNVSGLHRWDLMPAPGEGWTLKFGGLLDMRSQKLDLATTAAPEEKIPVALKFKATDFISAPKTAATMILHDLPAASLAGTARHFGVVLPDNVTVEGRVNGAIGFSYPEGLQGELEVRQASFKFPSEGSAQIDSAEIVIANRKVAMEPAELTLDNGRTARIQARYDGDTQNFAMQIETKLLTAEDLKSGPAHLVTAESIPVLANLREGSWAGAIRYEKKGDEPERWSGDFDVQNALLDLPGIAAPLHIASAGIAVDGGKVEIKNLRGRVGPISIQADYRFDTAGGPHFMSLKAVEVELGQLDRLLKPTLSRSQGLLANLRLRRAPVPEWLKDRDLDGSIQIAKLVRDDAPICAFKAHLSWTGAVAELTNATCSGEDMTAAGRITVNLAGAVPQYHLAGQVQNFDYRDGKLDLAGQFDSSGMGRDLLGHATSKGTFAGREIRFSTETALRDISGAFELGSGIVPRLVVTKIQASDGVDTFTGQGSSLADGRFVLDLITAGKRQVKLTGTLLPMHPSAAP
jgi:hypothetical protein